MTDITLQEIDDEVKRDQFAVLVKRYAPLIAAGALLLLLLVAGVQGWRYWQEKQQLQAAEALYEAQKTATIEAFSALTHSTIGGYGALAQLATGRLQADSDKPQEAIHTLLARADNSRADTALRELARLQAAYLALEYGDAAAMVATLETVSQDPKAVFPGLVKEWLALWAWKQGDIAKASTVLEALAKDPATPQGLQQRAERMAAVLSGQAPRYEGEKK
jgi:hypothetical protein